jgi:TrmH family RNA methyltransferase
MEYKKYNEECEHSYTFGGFPTFELLKNHPQDVIKIFVSSKLDKNEEWQKIQSLCNKRNISVEQNDKQIERLADKGNTYIVGVFKKYESNKNLSQNSVVLVSPSDMGNLGTIMREMLGFGYKNLVVIKPCADIFNPKVIRASMGAIFSLNITSFDNFESFEKENNLPLFLFMLNGTSNLSEVAVPKVPHALVFGNEATGLPKNFTQKGTSIKIHHSSEIDSLNLSMSVGIALYEFSKQNFK